MKPFRKLILSAAIVAATAGTAQAYGPYHSVGPCVNEDSIKAQQEAYEAQRNAQIQAIEAQKKAMADYMKNMQQQQQAAMEEQRKNYERLAPSPDMNKINEWVESQNKAMQAQQQAITEHMQTMAERNQSLWQERSKTLAPGQEFFTRSIPTFERPFAYAPQHPLTDELEAQHKAHLDAMKTQREAMQERMQQIREQHEAARAAQQKAFEEQRRFFNHRVALTERQTNQ